MSRLGHDAKVDTCDDCSTPHVTTIRVGADPYYESPTAYVCRGCLESALTSLEEFEAKETLGPRRRRVVGLPASRLRDYGIAGTWINSVTWQCRCKGVHLMHASQRHCAICLTDCPTSPKAST